MTENGEAGAGRPGKTIFHSLDGMRGVAALLVAGRHTDGFLSPWAAGESHLAVDLFFVLSGVVIAQAYGTRLRAGALSPGGFCVIRLVRIMPLYLLGSAVTLLATLPGLAGPLAEPLAAGTLATYAVLALLLLPNPGFGGTDVFPLDHPAWSLPLELAANTLYARFARRLTPPRIAAVMASSACGLVLTLCVTATHSLDVGFWTASFPFAAFRVGYSFFAGLLLFHHLPALRRRLEPVPWPDSAAWLLLALTAGVLCASPSPAVRPFYDLAAATTVLPALVALALLVQPAGWSARVFRVLGLVSYAAYTLHAPLGTVLGHGTGGWMDRHAPWSGCLFLLGLLPACALVDRWFDAPVRRRLLAWHGARGRVAGAAARAGEDAAPGLL